MDSSLHLSKSTEKLEKDNKKLAMEIFRLRKTVVRLKLERKYLFEKLHSDYTSTISNENTKKRPGNIGGNIERNQQGGKKLLNMPTTPIVSVITPGDKNKRGETKASKEEESDVNYNDDELIEKEQDLILKMEQRDSNDAPTSIENSSRYMTIDNSVPQKNYQMNGTVNQMHRYTTYHEPSNMSSGYNNDVPQQSSNITESFI